MRRLQARLRDKPGPLNLVLNRADYDNLRDHLDRERALSPLAPYFVNHFSVERQLGFRKISIDDRVQRGDALFIMAYRPEPLDSWPGTVPQSIQAFAVADAPTLPEDTDDA